MSAAVARARELLHDVPTAETHEDAVELLLTAIALAAISAAAALEDLARTTRQAST